MLHLSKGTTSSKSVKITDFGFSVHNPNPTIVDEEINITIIGKIVDQSLVKSDIQVLSGCRHKRSVLKIIQYDGNLKMLCSLSQR